MRTALLAAATATVFVAGQAWGASRSDPRTMMQLYRQANEQCRGGPGDDKATTDACDEREAYSKRLTQLGYCFGGPQGWWSKCRR